MATPVPQKGGLPYQGLNQRRLHLNLGKTTTAKMDNAGKTIAKVATVKVGNAIAGPNKNHRLWKKLGHVSLTMT
jgi:hypothetical protein